MKPADDKIWMQRALSLAQNGLGFVSPNPMVGCVIVSESGDIIGEGYHERYGEAHAEVAALKSVTDRAKLKGATMYVTLEPCSHHGKTPPCADLVSKQPLKRVVISMKDPFKEVDGKGIDQIRKAGIRVDVGVLKKEAEKLNEKWLHYLEFGRPFITLKIAQSADGYIAAPNGDSKWISSEESRKKVHLWRSQDDAVLVGRNTALHDNPSLTVRMVEGRQPKRVVIDGPRLLPDNLNLFSDAFEEKTIILTYEKSGPRDETDPMLKILHSNYFRGEIVITEKKMCHIDLRDAMNKLGALGITSLLVEGGQQLSSALLREGLVDRLQLFIAPKLLGGGTKSVFGLGIERMEDVIPFRDYRWEQVGPDMLLTSNL